MRAFLDLLAVVFLFGCDEPRQESVLWIQRDAITAWVVQDAQLRWPQATSILHNDEPIIVRDGQGTRYTFNSRLVVNSGGIISRVNNFDRTMTLISQAVSANENAEVESIAPIDSVSADDMSYRFRVVYRRRAVTPVPVAAQ